jgi:hypothetical protein
VVTLGAGGGDDASWKGGGGGDASCRLQPMAASTLELMAAMTGLGAAGGDASWIGDGSDASSSWRQRRVLDLAVTVTRPEADTCGAASLIRRRRSRVLEPTRCDPSFSWRRVFFELTAAMLLRLRPSPLPSPVRLCCLLPAVLCGNCRLQGLTECNLIGEISRGCEERGSGDWGDGSGFTHIHAGIDTLVDLTHCNRTKP